MLNKYFVCNFIVNQSGGNSENTLRFDTEDEARKKFFDLCSSVGGNPQTRAMHIEIKNPNGLTIKYEDIENPPINTEE